MVTSPPSNSEQLALTTNQTATKKVALDVQGMKCAGCVKAVERQLEQNSGVISACVNLITEVAVVEYQPQSIAPEAMAEKLTQTGFPSQLRPSDRSIYQLATANQQKFQQQSQERLQQLVAAIVLLVFSSLGHLHHLGLPMVPLLSNIWVHFALATLALAIPGRSLIIDGWRCLTQSMPNMNTLVGLGTVSAYGASCLALFWPGLGWECFFDEPVMLLGFILLGRTLEGSARHRASAALEQLVNLQPPVARLVGQQGQGETIEIPVEQVRPGEWLRILSGEKVPVDGVIVSGTATLDESMLTGESTAVLKTISDRVRAGTISQSGVITVQVTAIGSQTTLARIINLVEEAQISKAPAQMLADTIAGYFAYGVMALAVLTFGFWYGLGTKVWPTVLASVPHNLAMPMGQMTGELMAETMATSPLLLSLKLAIAVLVIACPCALGLATPTAILVGTSRGAESGILIKGGAVLEQVHQLDTIVFDKTGTLTTGEFQVVKCISLGQSDSQRLLQLAATVEQGSNHPLAQAILKASQTEGLDLLPASQFQTQAGQGIAALIARQQVYLGNRQWLQHQNINITQTVDAQVRELASSGKTVLFLAIARQLQGLIVLEDRLRSDALATMQELTNMGLKTILLSGDRQEVAQSVAQQLQLPEFFAEVQPEGKAQIIKSLQQQSRVAMVGDGINDAPALAQADVGITLQGGTDVALATADIVLMQNRLSDVVSAIKLSRATVSKIKQNLGWAFGYNVIAIPIAAGALLPHFGILLAPVWAAGAMATSSLLVVTNSLLLSRKGL